MPVTLSIKNVPDEIVAPLRERAKRNHRSLQGELMAILDDAAKRTPVVKRSIEEVYADLKAMGVRTTSNATEIVRQARDARSSR